MTVVFLVRHAAYDFGKDHLAGRSDHELSSFGKAQAERLARYESPKRITLLQSSPRQRCRQTIEPLAARTKRPIEVSASLDEIDFGCWAGMSFSALEENPLWQQWNEHRSCIRPPGGETMEEAQFRIVAHLTRLSAAYPGGTIVVATHAELVRAVILHCLSLSLDDWGSIDIPYGSITTIAIGRSGQMFVDRKAAA